MKESGDVTVPTLSTNHRLVAMDTPGWAATAFHIREEQEEQTSAFMCAIMFVLVSEAAEANVEESLACVGGRVAFKDTFTCGCSEDRTADLVVRRRLFSKFVFSFFLDVSFP